MLHPSDPFNMSCEVCSWPGCQQRIDMDMYRRDVWMCREHVLFTWSVVDVQMRELSMTPDDLAEQKRQQEQERAAEFERRCRKRRSAGTVYYLRVGKHIKIGHAQVLLDRLRAYPPGTELLAIEAGTLADEQNRHRDFADLRAAGREWYWPRKRLMAHIESLAETGEHLWVEDSWWQKKEVVSVPASLE